MSDDLRHHSRLCGSCNTWLQPGLAPDTHTVMYKPEADSVEFIEVQCWEAQRKLREVERKRRREAEGRSDG